MQGSVYRKRCAGSGRILSLDSRLIEDSLRKPPKSTFIASTRAGLLLLSNSYSQSLCCARPFVLKTIIQNRIFVIMMIQNPLRITLITSFALGMVSVLAVPVPVPNDVNSITQPASTNAHNSLEVSARAFEKIWISKREDSDSEQTEFTPRTRLERQNTGSLRLPNSQLSISTRIQRIKESTHYTYAQLQVLEPLFERLSRKSPHSNGDVKLLNSYFLLAEDRTRAMIEERRNDLNEKTESRRTYDRTRRTFERIDNYALQENDMFELKLLNEDGSFTQETN
ncbi:hypothetical protein F5878DRAFT_613575 [Lentinula raphanica]|uniref:Uncharacterized protein n=1 Tax=Lentinula raphanica TaxID=153919 RepID=A0AA38PCC4_9AGAR|nr:hypothetical protein F5878DRAFT_613575 [Lentinula raphanica]